MGKPVTLLESLCAHAISFHARLVVVEPKDGREWVYIKKRTGNAIRVADWNKSSSEAKELLENLHHAVKKPIRAILDGEVSVINVRVLQSLGEDAFEVNIEPAPKLDPDVPPKFTAKQGQYLAYIHRYINRYGQAPAEIDMERFFMVSAPSVNAMMQTLQRNGLIERTPKQARSIRLLVKPEHLPKLNR